MLGRGLVRRRRPGVLRRRRRGQHRSSCPPPWPPAPPSSTSRACSARTRRCRSWCPRSTPTAWTATRASSPRPTARTIQMVVALKPIYDAAGIERVVVSTYQAVSGSGQRGVDDLDAQAPPVVAGEPVDARLLSAPDRLQPAAAHRQLPALRLHQGGAEDGRRDARRSSPTQTIKVTRHLRARAGVRGALRGDQRPDQAQAQRRPRRASCSPRRPGHRGGRRPGAARSTPCRCTATGTRRRVRRPHPRGRHGRERPRPLVRVATTCARAPR